MLVSLRLMNFRCFDDHTIPFRARTVIIGRNNAGKSTVVEALRLVALIVERHKTASYKALPVWLDLLRGTRGIIPALDRQAFDLGVATLERRLTCRKLGIWRIRGRFR